MRSSRWTLTQYYGCPHQNGTFSETHEKGRCLGETEGEDGRLRAQERGCGRNQSCRHSDLGLLAFGVRGQIAVVQAASLWSLVKAALANSCKSYPRCVGGKLRLDWWSHLPSSPGQALRVSDPGPSGSCRVFSTPRPGGQVLEPFCITPG